MPKPNYQFEKRQRELEKKRKKAEKAQRKEASVDAVQPEEADAPLENNGTPKDPGPATP